MHICCGSTAYSVGTVWRGKEHLYTPGVRPASLATPYLASLATPCQADTGTRSISQQRHDFVGVDQVAACELIFQERTSKLFCRSSPYVASRRLGLHIAQLRIARHVMLGIPHPAIHQTAKAAAPKAGPKDADADWDIVGTDDLSVGKDEIRGMYTLWNHQVKRTTDPAGTPGGKPVDKEPDDDYVIIPTAGRKRNITRFAGSELEIRAKLAAPPAPRVEKVTVNASKALGVGKTPTEQLEELLDMSTFPGKKVAGK
jgi:hypothetical protein